MRRQYHDATRMVVISCTAYQRHGRQEATKTNTSARERDRLTAPDPDVFLRLAERTRQANDRRTNHKGRGPSPIAQGGPFFSKEKVWTLILSRVLPSQPEKTDDGWRLSRPSPLIPLSSFCVSVIRKINGTLLYREGFTRCNAHYILGRTWPVQCHGPLLPETITTVKSAPSHAVVGLVYTSEASPSVPSPPPCPPCFSPKFHHTREKSRNLVLPNPSHPDGSAYRSHGISPGLAKAGQSPKPSPKPRARGSAYPRLFEEGGFGKFGWLAGNSSRWGNGCCSATLVASLLSFWVVCPPSCLLFISPAQVNPGQPRSGPGKMLQPCLYVCPSVCHILLPRRKTGKGVM